MLVLVCCPLFPSFPHACLPSCSFLSLPAAPSETVSVWFSFCLPSSLLSLKQEGPKHSERRGLHYYRCSRRKVWSRPHRLTSDQITYHASPQPLSISLVFAFPSSLIQASRFKTEGFRWGFFFFPLSGSYLTQFALNCCHSLFFVYLLPQLPQPRLRYTNTVSSF